MTDATESRRYFTVLDESGHPAPAMEYWAAMPEQEEPVYAVLALRRFVKLIGSGEHLEETSQGVFVGNWSRRTFFRLEPHSH